MELLNEVDRALLHYMLNWFQNELEDNDPNNELEYEMKREMPDTELAPIQALDLLAAKLGFTRSN